MAVLIYSEMWGSLLLKMHLKWDGQFLVKVVSLRGRDRRFQEGEVISIIHCVESGVALLKV